MRHVEFLITAELDMTLFFDKDSAWISVYLDGGVPTAKIPLEKLSVFGVPDESENLNAAKAKAAEELKSLGVRIAEWE